MCVDVRCIGAKWFSIKIEWICIGADLRELPAE